MEAKPSAVQKVAEETKKGIAAELDELLGRVAGH